MNSPFEALGYLLMAELTMPPEDLRLQLLALRAAKLVEWTDLEESDWKGQPVWICHGMERERRGAFLSEERISWWIGKSDLLVKKMERDGGVLRRETQQAPHGAQRDIQHSQEFTVIELRPDIPGGLLEMPTHVASGEKAGEGTLEWLEALLAGPGG